MSVSQEQFEALRARVNAYQLVGNAWRQIAQERGYMIDMALNTTSRGTIAIISYLRAKGL